MVMPYVNSDQKQEITPFDPIFKRDTRHLKKMADQAQTHQMLSTGFVRSLKTGKRFGIFTFPFKAWKTP
jgi:Na+/H+ antiporter NhaA